MMIVFWKILEKNFGKSDKFSSLGLEFFDEILVSKLKLGTCDLDYITDFAVAETAMSRWS